MKRSAVDATGLTDAEDAELNRFLGRVVGGMIHNTEALDGFFAAIACCPDMIMPSEYLPEIQSGETEDGDLNFEDMAEARRFMELAMRHHNFVNDQLMNKEGYWPLIHEDDDGNWRGNDWAKGFLKGTNLRQDIWSEIIQSEERGGSIIPIFALASEDHPDPEMRLFKESIDQEKREEVLIAAAAGVMRMHDYFLQRRADFAPESSTFTRGGAKVGRNAPCPCGSGRKFKQCCGNTRTLH